MGIYALVLGFTICAVTALTTARYDDTISARPLCVSQFALVNHACKSLPYYPVPVSPPPSPHVPLDPDEPPVVEPPPAPEDPEGHRRHTNRSGSPGPMPQPSLNHHHHHHHHHHHLHRRHHHHHHHHRHQSSPIEESCCRWLREVDTECVCEILVLMPSFMAKPVHVYTVVVPEVCTVNFVCAGRLRME